MYASSLFQDSASGEGHERLCSALQNTNRLKCRIYGYSLSQKIPEITCSLEGDSLYGCKKGIQTIEMTLGYCIIKGNGRALSTHELGDLMLGARAFCAEVILSNGTRKIWLEDLKDDDNMPGLQVCLIDSDSDSDSDSDIDWF